MEDSCRDLVQWVGSDSSTTVFMRLEDPADLVRLSSVSRSWHRFVIANGFCKKLCLRMFPEVSKIIHVVEVSSLLEIVEVGSSTSVEWKSLEREHRVYAYLIHFLMSPMAKMDCICILEPIGASSTDRYPAESIENTLEASDSVNWRPSYWSSKGESDPGVPETLTYRLRSNLCLVNGIKIKPFKAIFHGGYPIYSAETVLFRMGHSRYTQETRTNMTGKHAAEQESDDDKYVWEYVSPEFPMAQENVLQSFELPRPVICIGGIVQIELICRVQKCAVDDLYYICMSHVQVVGFPLSPVFDVDILESTGSSVLKYFPGIKEHSEDEAGKPSH